MSKAYILVFDRDYKNFDYLKFHETIKKSKYIITWWHYIQSCYILISDLSADELSDKIIELMPKNRFLLTQVNLNNSNGWLNEKAWDFIYRHSE